ncbi:MAG: response regulator transcription factor [Ruminococcaceae bacterium]|nr:response regulator transcription factor [Oscillospiraceae bacterium]
MRLLIAEDEKALNNVITKRLTAEGYSVDSCYDGEEALSFLEMGEYDAVILDIMMPILDGLSVLKTMRSEKNSTPVLLLTAKDSIDDRVTGLDAGAQDYLIKPFAFEELLARIRAMTRKAAGNTTNIFEIEDLVLDINSHTVTRGGKTITLSAKEFDILEYMIRNKGIVLSREKIENHVWNFDYCGGTNVVDVYIRYLRKKIDDDFDVKLIETVRGKGYVLRVGGEQN